MKGLVVLSPLHFLTVGVTRFMLHYTLKVHFEIGNRQLGCS